MMRNELVGIATAAILLNWVLFLRKAELPAFNSQPLSPSAGGDQQVSPTDRYSTRIGRVCIEAAVNLLQVLEDQVTLFKSEPGFALHMYSPAIPRRCFVAGVVLSRVAAICDENDAVTCCEGLKKAETIMRDVETWLLEPSVKGGNAKERGFASRMGAPLQILIALRATLDQQRADFSASAGMKRTYDEMQEKDSQSVYLKTLEDLPVPFLSGKFFFGNLDASVKVLEHTALPTPSSLASEFQSVSASEEGGKYEPASASRKSAKKPKPLWTVRGETEGTGSVPKREKTDSSSPFSTQGNHAIQPRLPRPKKRNGVTRVAAIQAAVQSAFQSPSSGKPPPTPSTSTTTEMRPDHVRVYEPELQEPMSVDSMPNPHAAPTPHEGHQQSAYDPPPVIDHSSFNVSGQYSNQSLVSHYSSNAAPELPQGWSVIGSGVLENQDPQPTAVHYPSSISHMQPFPHNSENHMNNQALYTVDHATAYQAPMPMSYPQDNHHHHAVPNNNTYTATQGFWPATQSVHQPAFVQAIQGPPAAPSYQQHHQTTLPVPQSYQHQQQLSYAPVSGPSHPPAQASHQALYLHGLPHDYAYYPQQQ